MANLLEVQNLEVMYDDVILAVRDISLNVAEHSIVALLGANGAGKTSTLKAISQLLAAERGAITRGSVRYRTEDVTRSSASHLVSLGVVQVLEGRHCFPHLTVDENLRSGALARRASAAETKALLQKIYDYFPRLGQRIKAKAGLLSGGEQQMVAIGRALLARPRLVLLDEPSMGLAPQLVEEIFSIVRRLNRDDGVSFLVAEQNTSLALEHADYAYVLENGAVSAQGAASSLANDATLHAAYFGKSFGGAVSSPTAA